jgi:chromosome partitioning protein
MKTTLVINPKGGSGKTTIAINLAASFAAENIPTTLMDYDPQASSLTWLRSRAPDAPHIHGANGAPEKYGRMRSFEMYVPPHTQQLIIDAPAGASGLLLHEMAERAHNIVVPVVPSIIDIRATETFIKDLSSTPRVRNGDARVGIVAVTGWGKPEDELRTREAGFDMHLIKPVEEAQIRAALEAVNGKTRH